MNKKILKKIIYNENKSLNHLLSEFGKYSMYTNSKAFALVVDSKKICVGSVTDGDIRRYLKKGGKKIGLISEVMKKNFIALPEKRTLNLTLRKFESLFSTTKGIYSIPILDKKKRIKNLVNHNELSQLHTHYVKLKKDKNKKKLFKDKSVILVSVPTRLSFVGGGYDFTDYISEQKNYILSAALDHKVYLKIELIKEKRVKINIVNKAQKIDYSLKEIDSHNDLISCVLKSLNFNSGIKISIFSDFDIGTGLGGSSSVVVGLILGISKLFKKDINYYRIANLAYNAERLVFGKEGGWQDFFTPFYGGLNWITMSKNDINVSDVNINQEIIEKLNSEIVFFRYGKTRDSSKIQKFLVNNYRNKKNINSKKIKNIAIKMKSLLLNNDLLKFYKMINLAWEDKIKNNPESINHKIRKIYDMAIKNGAYAGKLLGAGESGYFVFFVPLEYRRYLIQKLKKYNMKHEKIKISKKGISFT